MRARCCSVGYSLRAVPPCQPTSGCEVFGPKTASVSERTKHEGGDRDSDRRWSPDQYERFRSERQQPFDDLLMLCHPVPGGRVVDLGCGTGDLTKILHEELQAKETVGVDSSPAMLARAQTAYRKGAGALVSPGRHRQLARRGPRTRLRQRVPPVDRRPPQSAGADADRAGPGRAAGVPGARQLPAPLAPPGARGGQRAAVHRRALRGHPRGPRALRALARAVCRPSLRARGEGSGRADGGVRPRARVDGRSGRVGHGHPAHAVSQAPQPGAVRRVRRAVPGAADRRVGGARALLLRVPAHPLLGARFS